MFISKEFEYKIEKLGGIEIPFGIDPLYDIQKTLKGYYLRLIVDVGANIGQSTNAFIDRFPQSQIHCIEPVSGTFDELKRNTASFENVHCHNLGFGARNFQTSLEIDINASSRMHSLINPNKTDDQSGYQNETICIRTLSAFCSEYGIGHINYLKIDTEGYDLEVLKGGRELLDLGAIDFIEVEAGMNPGNTYHVSMMEIKDFLEKAGYFIFGIYEQVHEWPTERHFMRRSNVLFISEALSDGRSMAGIKS
jgi:FkbM family methyltransferase